MRKKIFLTLAAIALLALMRTVPATAASLAPGASPDIWDMMQTQSQMQRVRHMAYVWQSFRRNDSSLGLTCYDQQLKITAALGRIFSDKIPAVAPPPSPAYTGPLSYPDRGRSDPLAGDLALVIEPIFSVMITNFTGSPANLIGAGISIFAAWASTIVSDFLSNIFGWAPPLPVMDCNRIALLWDNNAGGTGNPAIVGHTIKGSGINMEAGPIAFLDILLGNWGGMGSMFTLQLQNDRDILNKALIDHNRMKPGGIATWPTPPLFSPDVTVQDVINAM